MAATSPRFQLGRRDPDQGLGGDGLPGAVQHAAGPLVVLQLGQGEPQVDVLRAALHRPLQEDAGVLGRRQVHQAAPELDALRDLLEPAPEVLLVGVGERLQRFLPPEVIDRARSRGIVVEQMDTPNACATFNILSQEKRRVAGAFLTIEPQAYHASELDDL